jgi:hypothetical protein
MAGPLSLLGDVLMRGAGDYADRKDRAVSRQQQLDDRAAERAFQQEVRAEDRAFQESMRRGDREYQDRVRGEEQTREERLYNARLMDSVRVDAIRNGLPVEDAKDNTKLATFLNKNGMEYARKAQEIASMKAALADVQKQIGNDVPELAEIATADPATADMEKVRAIWRKGVEQLQTVIAKKISTGEESRNAGRAILGVLYQQNADVQLKIAGYQQPPTELEITTRATEIAQQNAKGKTPTEEDIEGSKETARKAITDERYIQASVLSGKASELSRTIASTIDAANNGLLDKAAADAVLTSALGGLQRPPGGAATAPAGGATNTDEDDALAAILGDAPPVVPAETPAPAALDQALAPAAPPVVPQEGELPAVITPPALGEPSFFGRDRDPALNRRRVVQFVKDAAGTPREMVAQAGRVLTPSNWKYDGSTRGGSLTYEPNTGPHPAAFDVGRYIRPLNSPEANRDFKAEAVASLRARAAVSPPAMRDLLLEEADRLDRSLAQSDTSAAQRVLVGDAR